MRRECNLKNYIQNPHYIQKYVQFIIEIIWILDL